MRLLRVAGSICLCLSLCQVALVAAAKPKSAAATKAAKATAPSKPASVKEKSPEAPAEKPAPEKKSDAAPAPDAKAEAKPAEAAPKATSAETATSAAASKPAAETPKEATPAPAATTPSESAAETSAAPAAAAEASVQIGKDDKARDKDAAAPPAATGERGPIPLELRLYGGMLSRQFTYSDNQSQNRDFDGTGPLFGLRVAVYPAAFALAGIPAHLGIVGGYSKELAPDTLAETGIPALTTESQEWYVGLKGRLPVREHELGLELRFVSHDYKLAGDEAADSRPCAWNSVGGDRGLPLGVSCFFPDVAYRAVEPQAEVRFHFGPLMLGAQAGVRVLLSTGELSEPWWFANAGGAGLDLGVLGGFQIIERLHVMVGGNLRQYGFDFNPLAPGRSTGRAPGPVAGGAVDRYVSGWLGLNYALAGRPL